MKEELSDREKQLFRELAREKDPDPIVETKLIQRLRSEGLLKTTNIMNTYLKWAAVIAAVIGAYFIGNYAPKSNAQMSYMMILMEDEQFHPGEPYQMYTEYRDWMFALREKGIEISGQELKDDAMILKYGEKIRHLSGDAESRVTGYFVFSADSREEAIEIAENNPHIKYGGTIQLKEFMIRN